MSLVIKRFEICQSSCFSIFVCSKSFNTGGLTVDHGVSSLMMLFQVIYV